MDDEIKQQHEAEVCDRKRRRAIKDLVRKHPDCFEGDKYGPITAIANGHGYKTLDFLKEVSLNPTKYSEEIRTMCARTRYLVRHPAEN